MPLRHEGKECGSSPLKGELGMTCLLRPAFTSMDASLPCHSSRGVWGSGNLWEAVQKNKIFVDGLNSYRSQAYAHLPSQG